MKQNNIDINPIKKLEQNFTREMINDTIKYQRIYGFYIGANNNAHNNESDAFRHAYMQAYLSIRYSSSIAKMLGDLHEKQGNSRNQDRKEANMDLWNNEQGREIADEIIKENPFIRFSTVTQIKDTIAFKVFQRMRAGQLITGLSDERKYIDKEKTKSLLHFTPARGVGGVWNNAQPMGYAAPTDFVDFAQQQGIIIPESMKNELNNMQIQPEVFPQVNNTQKEVYNYGLSNSNKVQTDDYKRATVPTSPKVQANYTNIPQIDFDKLFPKTVMPTPMPTVTVPPINITTPTPVYNNYTSTNSQPNYALANTALQLLKTIWQNRRKNNLSGYTNPITGDNRIFTREDVGQMSQEEFDKNEKALMAQLKAMNGLPTNGDMHREALNGGAIYVNPYTRSDGTNVKGYYRSRPRY